MTTTEPQLEPTPLSVTPDPAHAGSRWIDDWRPEDPEFWATTGEPIARRNLVFSIISEHIGFSVWSIWSVLVLFLGPKYGFTPEQKFLLTSTPTLVGSILRVPYTFAVAKFGGRNWTVFSALLLIVPLIAGAAVLKPGVSFSTVMIVAALAGVGGGNFASSMANINAYFPEKKKGWALGLNAGGGNIGVAAVQLIGLLVLATAGKEHPRVLLGIYMPLVVLAAVGAALTMNNLSQARNEKGAMREILSEPNTWIISLLYIGTFGSFIGFGFAFGQVLQVQFASDFNTPIKAAQLTFIGPLLGSLIRPVGGLLADRFGGARVTLTNFVAMAAAALLVLVASKQHSLAFFLTGFVLLFIFSGIGNGSCYKMIPALFRAKATVNKDNGDDPVREDFLARRRSGALIGLAGAIGGLGGVLVNLAFRQSFLDTKTGDRAYIAFLVFYGVCVLVTYLAYVRPGARKTIAI